MDRIELKNLQDKSLKNFTINLLKIDLSKIQMKKILNEKYKISYLNLFGIAKFIYLIKNRKILKLYFF